MKKRTIYLVQYAPHLIFVSIVLSIMGFLYVSGLRDSYLILAGTVLYLALLPLYRVAEPYIERFAFGGHARPFSTEFIDVIFQAQTTDDLVNSSLDSILHALDAKSCTLVIYNDREDLFDEYQVSGSSRKAQKTSGRDSAHAIISAFTGRVLLLKSPG